MKLLLAVKVVSVVGLSAPTTPQTNAGEKPKRMNYLQNLTKKPEQSKADLTPEERQKEWAAKIIEQHQQMQKDGKKVVQPVRRIPPKKAQRQETSNEANVRYSGSRVQLIPEIGGRGFDKEASLDPGTLLDVFDGSLGRLRLALRSSDDAMLSVTSTFRAESADDAILLKGHDDIECVLDSRACCAIDFNALGDNQFAITLKRFDNSAFLSALLLSSDDAPLDDAVVTRWHSLRDTYGN